MMKRESLVDALCVMTLVGFALVQPLYDLLSRNAAFFIFHHSEPGDILILVALLSIALPLLFAGVMLLLPGRKWVLPTMLILLTALILAPILSRIRSLPSPVSVTLSLLGGVGIAWARQRWTSIRYFFLSLSPALVVFPILFLLNGEISPLLGHPPEPPIHEVKAKKAPVIVVVFDEFPLASLLNEKYEIDARRYPNFAELANRSHWFRQATTVHPWTSQALPAILSGNRTKVGQKPRWQDHPRTLFTLLGHSHEARLTQSGFSSTLCPTSLNQWQSKPAFADRMGLLLRDLLVVEGHLLLPREWTQNLPAIDTDWANFWQSQRSFTDRREQFAEFLTSLKSKSERPGLHFFHSMLPHTPSSFLPSGKGYGRDNIIVGMGQKKAWGQNQSLIDHAHQRHLLQVGYVDRLLGELIARLKELKIYDECLLVITADHGISFRAGLPYRAVTHETRSDILRIPLFIKLPNQKQGKVSDENVQHVDILPTIADALEVEIPWSTEGRSALQGAMPKEKHVLVDGKSHRFGATLDGDWGVLSDQIQKFGVGEWSRLFGNSPLLGRRIDKLKLIPSQVQCRIDSPEMFRQLRPVSTFVPARIQGTLPNAKSRNVRLAIAVNGTIRAVTESRGSILWAAMVPEESFQAGDNRVEVLQIHEGETFSRLCETGEGESVTYRLRGDELVDSRGRTYEIRRKAHVGYLDIFHADRSCVTFSGWSADVKRKRLPKRIVMLADGEHFHVGSLSGNREDVVTALGDERFKWCGFNFCFPRERFREHQSKQFRFFAVSEDGIATELRYHDWYQRRGQRPFLR